MSSSASTALQVVGVLGAGIGVAWSVRRRAIAGAHPVLAAATAALIVLAIVLAGHRWSSDDARAALAPTGVASHAAAPSPPPGFWPWVRHRLLADGSRPVFWLAPALARSDATAIQYSSYALFPARLTSVEADASWIVFDGVSNRELAHDRSAFGQVIVYRHGFAVAERADGG
jgi:hypothetical protein